MIGHFKHEIIAAIFLTNHRKQQSAHTLRLSRRGEAALDQLLRFLGKAISALLRTLRDPTLELGLDAANQ
jgi:hypothetical protein